MKVESIALDLRPRSMYEACDLGMRLVGANARSVWSSFLPVYAVACVIALSTVEIAGWLPLLVIFWLKPWLDRSLLFVLSRAVFGERTSFADLWAARGQVWWRHLLSSLTVARFSAWRAYVLPVQMLEGQPSDAARRKRVQQILHGKRGAAFAMQWAMSWVEASLFFGLATLSIWLAPEGTGSDWFSTLMKGDHTGASLLQAAMQMSCVFIVEPFFVGAGFAMYLNRRVELEAWDIEQEFRLVFGA